MKSIKKRLTENGELSESIRGEGSNETKNLASPCLYCRRTVFGFYFWGGEAFFYLSWPVALLVESTKEIVLWGLVAGNVQWAIVGYIAERLLRRKTSKPPVSRQKV